MARTGQETRSGGSRSRRASAPAEAARATTRDRNGKSTVYSVLKACRLIDCFSHDHPDLSLSDLVQQSGIQKTTAHRLLATLERAGWIAKGEQGRYRLTIRLFQIGSIVADNLDLRTEAQSLLSHLAAELGDTAHLVIPAEGKAVCLDRIEGVNPVAVRIFDVGQSLPLHVGAGPLALLAFREDELLPEVAKTRLVRYTPNTITDIPALRHKLEEIRQRGYSLSVEDVVPNVCAVGAPVFDKTGAVVAAISTGGIRERFQPPRLAAIAAAVVDAARALSEHLGAAPEPRGGGRGPTGADERRAADVAPGNSRGTRRERQRPGARR